jgi:hypothetical protein
MGFDPYNCILKIWESMGTPTPKVGVSLGSVRVYSLTLSCTLESMQHDSRASFLARNLATPCLGHEPKARIATPKVLG